MHVIHDVRIIDTDPLVDVHIPLEGVQTDLRHRPRPASGIEKRVDMLP